MKKLYLLRHAHAEDASRANLSDHERTLSTQGAREAERLGDFMRAQRLMPDFVLSSSSVRTLQTVRGVCARLLKNEGQAIGSSFDRKLYLAPADVLMSEIQGANDDVQGLLVVGHNPGIAELAFTLSRAIADYTQDYAPATLSVFKVNTDSWADLSPATIALETVFVAKS